MAWVIARTCGLSISGETYYVIDTVNICVLAGHPNLSPSDQATFDGMAAKLKPAE